MTCAALAALALGLTGCSDDEPDPGSDDRTSVSWVETDVCSLVDGERVAELLGDGATAQETTDRPRRPECEWSVGGATERLVLRLWQPPVPDALADGAERTTEVGDRTGYVQSETRGSCSMHVEAEPAWLTVDLDVPQDRSGPQLCDQVAPLADEVLAEVR